MLTIVALALLGTLPLHAPVGDGAGPTRVAAAGWRCNLARIGGAQRVQLRARPGDRHPVTGALAAGTTVFVCDEARDARDRHWVRIAYRTANKPCEGGGRDGLDFRLSRHCTRGWIERRKVEILSG